MHPRVTAILVARNGQKHLERTLEALTKQTRQPDVIIAVDCGSTDATGDLLRTFGPTQIVVADASLSFGQAIQAAVRVIPAPTNDNEVLWFLAQDSAPEPAALAALLAEVEIAPSVAVAGPKIMEWVAGDYIHEFGRSVTPYGASVSLVESELDQGQHDDMSDVLGVGPAGMLVRHTVWQELGGFDPALPTVDDSLDFSIRARLAGHRVSVVAGARVATAGDGVAGPSGSSKGAARRKRMRDERAAQLHRRMVYAPIWALPLHWLTLVPLALIRSLGQLLRKEPGAVIGEFAAAFGAAFRMVRIGQARARLARARSTVWAALAGLRIPSAAVRRRYALKREAGLIRARGDRPDFDFFSGGGAWVVVGAAVVGLGLFASLLGAQTLTGGGLLPLSDSLAELWRSAGYGWRDIGLGFVGAADPFAAVVAVLGTLTFWAPSFALVLLYFLALPLAAFGAWAAASRLTARNGLRAVAAVLWVFSPPFLTALADGRPAAILVHLLLPWLFFAGSAAARSWSASASTALLFAAIVACAPALAPALLVGWLICVLLSGRRIMRFIGIPLPALALALPLIWDQAVRGNWLALLADPGLPLPQLVADPVQLLLGFPGGDFGGWVPLLNNLGFPDVDAALLIPILLAPLALLVVLSFFLKGARGASFAALTALLGFGTAIAANQAFLSYSGELPVAVWSGTGLSLYWLGLVGAALFALRGLGRFAITPAIVAAALVIVVAAPVAAALPLGTSAVAKGIGRTQPAFVAAEATIDPRVATLELVPQPNGGVVGTIMRGAGSTLNNQSTLEATDSTLSEEEKQFATFVGNLASQSGMDTEAALSDYGIRFVLLRPAAQVPGANGAANPVTPAAEETSRRSTTALDGNSALVPVGQTNFGELWQVAPEVAPAAGTPIPGQAGGVLGQIAFVLAVIVIGATVLLSIPTGAGREAVRQAQSDAIRRQAKETARAAKRARKRAAARPAAAAGASGDVAAADSPVDAGTTPIPAEVTPSAPLRERRRNKRKRPPVAPPDTRVPDAGTLSPEDENAQ